MYSGTTFTAISGRLAGAHQKIDRLAYSYLARLLNADNGFGAEGHLQTNPSHKSGIVKGVTFPRIKTILHFEGKNGPDAIKRKSPAQDEPWHYFSPFDTRDTAILDLMSEHYENLVTALRREDTVVAGFEAAWLAHTIVDGLTPAHHYPYEAKLDELRGGLGKETRVTYRDKLVMPGASGGEMLANNWKMWGPKGLFTTHMAFELGVAAILLPLRASVKYQPTQAEISRIRTVRITDYFARVARQIAALGIYDEFYTKGWTPRLARLVRQQLIPELIKAVVLVWYKAVEEAADAGKVPATVKA